MTMQQALRLKKKHNICIGKALSVKQAIQLNRIHPSIVHFRVMDGQIGTTVYESLIDMHPENRQFESEVAWHVREIHAQHAKWSQRHAEIQDKYYPVFRTIQHKRGSW